MTAAKHPGEGLLMKKIACLVLAVSETGLMLISLLMLVTTGAAAGTCAEHALLRQAPSDSQYKWTNKKPFIRVWESPEMVRVVGSVRMGSDVEVVSRSKGFIRINASEEGTKGAGWISESQVDHYTQPAPDGEGCVETAVDGTPASGPVR